MEHTKATPGPWEVSIFNQQLGNSNKRQTLYTIKDCEISYSIHPTEEQEANARLIAAAPDLLEACKAAMTDLIFPSCGGTHGDLYAIIQKAVMKATGKE